MTARAWISGVVSAGQISAQLSVGRINRFSGFLEKEASLPYLP